MGAVANIIADARLYADEPATSDKFDATAMARMLRKCWAEVMWNLNQISSTKIRTRYDITTVADQKEYVLPPHIGQILAVERVDSSGNVLWEIIPKHFLNPAGPGWQIEGPRLYLDPPWAAGETLRVTYVPNGEVCPHDGTGTFVKTDDGTSVTAVTGVTLAVTPTTGERDGRVQAYAGYVLRILALPEVGAGWSNGSSGGVLTETNIVQERVITSYDNTTRIATFAPTLDPLPAWTGTSLDADSDTCTYEILPAHLFGCEEALALRMARKLAGVSADDKRWKGLHSEYDDALRSLKMGAAQTEQRVGIQFRRAIRGRRG